MSIITKNIFNNKGQLIKKNNKTLIQLITYSVSWDIEFDEIKNWLRLIQNRSELVKKPNVPIYILNFYYWIKNELFVWFIFIYLNISIFK